MVFYGCPCQLNNPYVDHVHFLWFHVLSMADCIISFFLFNNLTLFDITHFMNYCNAIRTYFSSFACMVS